MTHLKYSPLAARSVTLGLLVTNFATIGVLAAPESAPEPPRADPTVLPQVIVTAEKEPEPVQSLPLSVSPVTYDVLREADIQEVKQAELYAPNVFINEFSARKLSNPYFRGIGSSPNNPAVTTLFDGVPQLNASSSSIELVDIERIEFVRGPQGALYGRNTAGGILNIVSRRPSARWRSDAQVEFGNYDYHDFRFSASGPLVTERAAVSIAGGYSERDGYTDNTVTGHDLDSRDAWFGKGQFLWTPNPLWDVLFILSGERDRDGDYALGDLSAIRAHPHQVSHDFEGYTHRDIIAPTLLASRHGSTIDFTFTSGVVWWQTRDLTDLDYTPIPAVVRDNAEEDLQVTEEIRFASAKDAPIHLADNLLLKWQSGVTFFSQNYDQDARNHYSPGILYQPNQYGPGLPPFASPANTRHAPQAELDDIGIGAYAQATVTAWEKLDLSVGLHGDYEQKNADLKTFFSTADPFLGPPTVVDDRADFSQVSPQVSLGWHLDPQKLVYLAVSSGYKAGGFNPISPAGQEQYDDEKSWCYELGGKSTWFEDRVSLNLSAFYIHWEDLQLNLPGGVPGQYYIDNAGAAASKGVELELQARPISFLTLFTTVGYTDARFLSGARAGHTDPMGVDTLVDVGGNHLIYSPDFTVSAGAQGQWELSDKLTLFVRGETVTYGRFFYNPVNTESQDAYNLANFRAGLRGKHWLLEGWVRNAFDTRYVPIAFEFPNGPFGGSGFVGETGAPVTYGIRAGLEF